MIYWAVLVLLLGLAIVIAEVFIPSGGILGFLATGLLILSLVLGFMVSPSTGVAFVVVIVLAVPALIAVGFHYLPRTPIGKKLFLAEPKPEDIDPRDTKLRSLEALRGQVGRTLTPLRPAGVSEIAGRRVDTVAEGVMIEQGQSVRVIAVQGNRVVVRKIEPEETSPPQPLQEPSFDLPTT